MLFELNVKKTESNPVRNRESNQVKQGDLNKIKHGENNQVSHGGQHGNVDVDDGANGFYLVERDGGDDGRSEIAVRYPLVEVVEHLDGADGESDNFVLLHRVVVAVVGKLQRYDEGPGRSEAQG